MSVLRLLVSSLPLVCCAKKMPSKRDRRSISVMLRGIFSRSNSKASSDGATTPR